MRANRCINFLIALAAALAASWSSLAQTPAPTSLPVPARGQGTAPAGDDAPGRGAGQRGAPGGQRAGQAWEVKGPILPVSPAEQTKRFWLQAGYRIEPVVSEPDVQEPVQIAFDGN